MVSRIALVLTNATVMAPPEAKKRLVIVGATGMVGGYALRSALDHTAVGTVTTIGRKPTGLSY
jgi:NADPH:quinone reductase-like Zn-dependent oxidoreductase